MLQLTHLSRNYMSSAVGRPRLPRLDSLPTRRSLHLLQPHRCPDSNQCTPHGLGRMLRDRRLRQWN